MGATPASSPCRLHFALVESPLGHAAMPPSLHSLLADGGLGVVVVLLLTLLLCRYHRRDRGDAITATTVMHGCTSSSPTPTSAPPGSVSATTQQGEFFFWDRPSCRCYGSMVMVWSVGAPVQPVDELLCVVVL